MFDIRRRPMHMPLLTELAKEVVHLFLSPHGAPVAVPTPPLHHSITPFFYRRV
jgi:hypothetical protein